ncbi:protein kinase [Kitasatospora sp. NBC_01560]|uniref:protein kinase domain-containing protein n=1 Tax=Kitasatospora sp. NBC_01560 TaxID=2975965 RepID=UPI00386D862D
MTRQICSGLTYLHNQGIFHRDLKPANILRTTGGGWALSDFGLARESERQSEALTSTLRQGLGTLVYAAPEQLMRPRDVDVRSDVLSLGRILQHLVAGELPLSDDLIENGPLRPVILRATVKHDRRYATPGELMDAIERALEAGKVTWEAPEDIAKLLVARMKSPSSAPSPSRSS